MKGFTFIEVIVVIVILAIAGAVAIPNFTAWLPDSRLKTAARDLFSNIQFTRMDAIKSNSSHTLQFNSAAGTYQNGQKTVQLSDYGSGVRFGSGTTTVVPGDVSPIDADFISYTTNSVIFDSRGNGTTGFVYLTNDRGTSYAVGSSNSGAVMLRKWDGASWD